MGNLYIKKFPMTTSLLVFTLFLIILSLYNENYGYAIALFFINSLAMFITYNYEKPLF